MTRKYKADKSELKTIEDIRNQRREALKQAESVDDILAAEAKQEQRRKPVATGKARGAKSPVRPVEDNPWHRPEPVTDATASACAGLASAIHATAASLAKVIHGQDNRPFGDTPPREVTRPALVAYALDIIRREGPQSTNALLDRAFPELSLDDRAALRQRLPKWLMAECRHQNPPLTMRRERSPEGGEKRFNLFGFWPEPRQGKSRRGVDVAEVLTAIAGLRAELIDLTGALSDELVILQRELVTIRQVQSELLQRQNLLKEGFAAMLEKLTWNGEL